MNRDKPYLGIWFGNFFEPFYSDFEATRKGIADVADLGFNSINLDSKPWEDFFARYRGDEASQYVAMHEFMMDEMARHGLDHTHLALYLNGDNLYPNIRSVPPVRGEEAILPDGSPMGTYNYRSPRARATKLEHVRGLLALYGDRIRRKPDGRRIMMTMWEPIPKPSFDGEGRRHYLQWLERRYGGDVSRINRKYGLAAPSFDGLEPDEFWLRPMELNWVGCARPSLDDFALRTPDFWRWVDNQTYLGEMLEGYLGDMLRQWRELDPSLFVEPQLHQWGYFFHPPGQRDWQTGQRALDVYRCAKHVDGVLYVSFPLNSENRADASALSVEGSILRNANDHRPFTGGLFLGRHVNADIYQTIPPAEAIATLIANGAKGIYAYGYSGLDDGGTLARMDSGFRESLRAGNRWAIEVIPLLSGPREREVALLFPAETSFYEPLEVDIGGRHRMDLLGWYRQFTDLGWHVDILHPDQVAAGALAGYRFLVVPANPLYDLGDNGGLESAVREFVESGGVLFHGPACVLAERVFGISGREVGFDCIKWREEIIPHGWSTVAFDGGESLATYIGSGDAAIARTAAGEGHIVSVGFEYGYSYARDTMPIVPPGYGKREMHPVILLETTPVAALAGISPLPPILPRKGVEFARFGKHWIIVNHRSEPIDISAIPRERDYPLVVTAPGWLAAHSAVVLETKG
ncbi:MAG: hypothetical protein J0M04_11840 [Verrucomicrobia bacterium]|nr:hypothetical protein [Verrucomicrobiota bacterium]